jgi:hypothetical protein
MIVRMTVIGCGSVLLGVVRLGGFLFDGSGGRPEGSCPKQVAATDITSQSASSGSLVIFL